MGSCKNCKSKTLTVDPVTGNLECTTCGVVQDFDNYEQQTFNADGPTGTNIRIGKSGSGYDYSYRETKLYLAQKIVSDILFKLDLENRIDEVNNMIKIITEEEYGTGNWFNVLVGACVYVIMRKANKCLPLTSVCSSVGCDHFELGRMVYRVVDHLDLSLPEFDIVGLFDRVLKEFVGFRTNIGKEMSTRMAKQGVFLIQCMIKWYVTTGRRPVPVVVAVIVFVSELNGVETTIDDLAEQLNVVAVTCKLRYKELLKRLIEVARDHLPWGKDVNVKNIMKNAPIVIQYMEMKSMCTPSKDLATVGVDLDGLVIDSLNEQPEDRSIDWNTDDLKRINVSPECLSAIYLKYLDEYSKGKSSMEVVDYFKLEKPDFFPDSSGYFSGNSELSKRLFLDRILEKDVGLNADPPAFVKGCLEERRRREKIEEAKVRIEKIRRPWMAEERDGRIPVRVSKRKRRVEADWEDFVIETLLLHEVKEEEIEKGYYNTLLDLHVFN